ncbi:MAG: PorT family protein [Bacteroidales bacterium]|nr:PorT family protein [Bacteroidales bacterium]
MKKTIIILAAMVLIGGTATAQEEKAKKSTSFDVEIGGGAGFGNLNGNLADFMAANHPASDYKETIPLSVQIHLADVFKWRNLCIGLHANVESSYSASVANQYTESENALAFLSLGYDINLCKNFSVQPNVGFGVSSSQTYLASKRSGVDFVQSYTTSNLIVPLTLNLWWNVEDEAQFGFYLGYNLNIKQVGSTCITGLESEVDGLRLTPTSFNAGILCRF